VLVCLTMWVSGQPGNGLRFRVIDKNQQVVTTDTIPTLQFNTKYSCTFDTLAYFADYEMSVEELDSRVVVDGFIIPPSSDQYTFYYSSSGSFKLTIGNTVIPSGASITLAQGQATPVTAEYKSTTTIDDIDCNGGVDVKWRAASSGLEGKWIPTDYLYTGINSTLPVRDKPGRGKDPAKSNLKVQTVTTDNVRVQSPKMYSYFLIDSKGRLLKRGNISVGASRVEMSNYPKGLYLLSIDGQSFKVIKE
jgi:hypothetical protein